MTEQPRIARAIIREEKAATSPTGRDGLVIVALFAGEDGESHGIALNDTPSHRNLAARLKAAVEAGVVFTDLHRKARADGTTYVAYATRVIGRTLNADLTRLGF